MAQIDHEPQKPSAQVFTDVRLTKQRVTYLYADDIMTAIFEAASTSGQPVTMSQIIGHTHTHTFLNALTGQHSKFFPCCPIVDEAERASWPFELTSNGKFRYLAHLFAQLQPNWLPFKWFRYTQPRNHESSGQYCCHDTSFLRFKGSRRVADAANPIEHPTESRLRVNTLDWLSQAK